MKQTELNKYWSNPENRALEASKYSSRTEFRKRKRTVYERCTYKELENYFGKSEEDREHKVRTDYGMTDYYKYYKKNVDSPINKNLYSDVLREYLKINHDIISKTAQPFLLPERIGEIVVRKFKREIEIDENGQLKNKFPVNWKATKQLWAENEQAKKDKILLRHTNEHTDGYFFTIFYMRSKAKFKAKSYYKMQINRSMRRALASPIINDKIDAFLGKPMINRR